MGVYIKGMEMPKSCIACLLNFGEKRPEYGLTIYCPCSDGVISWRDKAFDNGRLASCGIVPVQPHGRLGDLDKLVEKIDGIWDCNDMVFKPDDHCCNVPEDCKGCKWAQTKDCIQRMVENAPTIIPAEEGE